MVGALLLRGMLVGLVGGVLCFGFLRVAGEPSIERAIAFEQALDATRAHGDAPDAAAPGIEPELVSRATQSGIGLLTGIAVYGAALGGMFALAFAMAHGRIAGFGPRGTAALLALLGIVAVTIVPSLKYPASPPAVGDPATIGLRTALYFALIALSLAAITAAGVVRARLAPRWGAWNATICAGAAYALAMVVAALALPTVDEVPEHFPAAVLWDFRIAALCAQAILWATLGLGFGALTERAGTRRDARLLTPVAPPLRRP